MSVGSVFTGWDMRRAALVAPAVILLLAVCYYPLLWVIVQAFSKAGQPSLDTIVSVGSGPVFSSAILNTAALTAKVLIVTALVGYPLAYMVHCAPPLMSYVLKFLILFPFWTSTLVRTYAWVVILQRDGVLVNALQAIAPPLAPVSFMNSQTAVVIGMVHIMLPFFVFPVLASMSGVKPDYAKAAISLGARPMVAFWTVFFPLTISGLVSACVIVMMLSLGFYIIPIVLGGGKAPVISMVIERSLSLYPDWAVASSMGLLLLLLSGIALMALYGLAARVQRLWH
ncbi:ABC transporter permease [Rhodobacteraceae bacterium LMO-12]|nr:ABC transporter permease [Rhodobacteraceae bacterium LMO-JJ12]